LTAIGALVGALSLVIYLAEKAFQLKESFTHWVETRPGTLYKAGDIEYLIFDADNSDTLGLVPANAMSNQMKEALASAKAALEGQPIASIVLRPHRDFLAISDDRDHGECLVLLYRLRHETGLQPKQMTVSHNNGCRARYEKLMSNQEEAIVTWAWGGNGVVLALDIFMWDRTDFVPIEVDWNIGTGEAQFAFADLDGDGKRELIVAKANRWENPPQLTIFELTDSKPFIYRPVSEKDSRIKDLLQQVPDVSDSRLWEWLKPEDFGLERSTSPSKGEP
jgi:hypothetical protein